ncbi:MAG: hypothetical protein LBU07_02820 [Coriobacteriales bacterium]|nr:hypothetical protein [Coriobacteriales bacterium]
MPSYDTLVPEERRDGMDTLNGTKHALLLGEKDFYIALGDFLDNFYRASQDERIALISGQPIFPDTISKQERCFFAASVHKLANEYSIIPPSWIFRKKYYLDHDEPFFGGDAKGRLRQYFMYTSPPEFKHRNIFVDPNILMRV